VFTYGGTVALTLTQPWVWLFAKSHFPQFKKKVVNGLAFYSKRKSQQFFGDTSFLYL